MAEQVGGAPQEPHPGGLHLGCGPLHHGVEIGPALGQSVALGGHVHIVEAEKRRAQLLEELEGGVLFGPSGVHRVLAGLQPGPVERADAEDVAARPVEAVPVTHGNSEMVLHPPPQHLPIGVVNPIGQLAESGATPGMGHRFGNGVKEVGHCVAPSRREICRLILRFAARSRSIARTLAGLKTSDKHERRVHVFSIRS